MVISDTFGYNPPKKKKKRRKASDETFSEEDLLHASEDEDPYFRTTPRILMAEETEVTDPLASFRQDSLEQRNIFYSEETSPHSEQLETDNEQEESSENEKCDDGSIKVFKEEDFVPTSVPEYVKEVKGERIDGVMIYHYCDPINGSNPQDAPVCVRSSGRIVRLFVSPGQKVSAGQTLAIIESMKCEIKISTPESGYISKLPWKEGDIISHPSLLATIRLEGKA